MQFRQLTALAWRESRTARRRLLLYMSSIFLGVAALVAIDSFADNVTTSVREQAASLLGGDIALSSRAAFPDHTERLLDSLQRRGTRVERMTSFASMALVLRTDRTRLVNVRAVDPGHPIYGTVVTAPAGAYRAMQHGRTVVVDPSILVSLDAQLGDTLTLGSTRFVIGGTLVSVPGDVGISAAIGPRVFVSRRWLQETGLLAFGSRAEYEALLRLTPDQTVGRFMNRFSQRLRNDRVRPRTVAENEYNLTEAIDQLRSFLGIVGLVALLLGGLGVASGVHAFVMRKIDTVAVLRCLGATSRQVVAIYVLQATAMGLLGALAGAALGVGIQYAMPRVIGEFLPVDVSVNLSPRAIGLGLLVGGWVALVFSIAPLIALRRVSPLQALRREADGEVLRRARRDPLRWLVAASIVGSVLALGISRAGSVREGIGFSAAIGGAVGILWGAAALMAVVARRIARPSWPYVLRQGVANLHRPGNQTRAVALALGFGVFLMSTLYQVQSNLLRHLDARIEASRANVVFFDVQDDQQASLDSLVRGSGHTVVQRAPIIPMRIERVNSACVTDMLRDTVRSRRRAPWALRREYRSTYRSELVPSEKLVGGKWFGATPPGPDLTEASVEQELARELKVKLGDTLTWNVQGVPVRAVITSLREVNWARFEPNFFVVFRPEALDKAPKQWVLLAQTPEGGSVARLQRDVVVRHPNVSSLDLTLVQQTVERVLGRVTTAIRFLAVFCLALGLPVLFSAVAATRRERLREGVLLKTLGATRRQIGRIMLAEYALLGILGSLTGVLLSIGGAWGLSKFVFETDYVPAVLPALGVGALMTLIAVTIGLLTGREVFRGTPMAALRES